MLINFNLMPYDYNIMSYNNMHCICTRMHTHMQATFKFLVAFSEYVINQIQNYMMQGLVHVGMCILEEYICTSHLNYVMPGRLMLEG